MFDTLIVSRFSGSSRAEPEVRYDWIPSLGIEPLSSEMTGWGVVGVSPVFYLHVFDSVSADVEGFLETQVGSCL